MVVSAFFRECKYEYVDETGIIICYIEKRGDKYA